jgi:hypothetical protein
MCARTLKTFSLRAAAALLLLSCAGHAARGQAPEGGTSINPNPSNATLVWAGEDYLVWQKSTTVPGTEARHLPSAVFRYYVQGDPADVVPHVYEMTAPLGTGARVLGVVGQEATLVLAEEGKTVLVNASEALGLEDPRAAVTGIPSDWYAEPKDNLPFPSVPLAAYDEGVVAADARRRLIYLIPWAPGRARLDTQRKLLIGDLRGLEHYSTARDRNFTRKGDLLIWVTGRTLHVFDFKTREPAAHLLAAGLIGDPLAFDGERAVFTRYEETGLSTHVYDARTGRRLPDTFPPGGPAGHLLALKGGVAYLLEREKGMDANGRHAHRVAARDLRRGGARTPLSLVYLKTDAHRAYVHRLYFRGRLFFWDEDRWEAVAID